MGKKLKIAAAACTAVLLVGSVTLSSLTLYQQTRLTGYFLSETKDVAQEDDVKIAGEYVIKSTLPISDAYRSGDTSKLSDRDKETLDMAKEVIAQVITDGMTDFDKERAIYEYLTNGMRNSTAILTVVREEGSGDYDNPHDVLKNHSAVCVGYATTFRMFMQMMGIECKVVHSSDLIHSWDLVKLDDGCWYHTDCYMDSGESTYSNFNMNDTACKRGHEWNTDFFPKAEGTKYDYILSVCESVKDIYAVPKWVMNALKNRKNVISCTFEKALASEDDERAAAYMVDSLTEKINYSDKVMASSDWRKNADDEYVLCLFLSYTDDDEAMLSEKTRNKIDNKIDQVLEDYDFYATYNDVDYSDYARG